MSRRCPMCDVPVQRVVTVLGVTVPHFSCPVCKRIWVGDPTPLTLCAYPDKHVGGQKIPSPLKGVLEGEAA